MNHEKLITFLGHYGKISDSDKSNIRKHFVPLKVNKKQILIDKYSPCNKLFFVNSGILRTFCVSEKGREITRMFAWEKRFITNIASFKNNTENHEVIDCIKNSEILYINREDFYSIINSSLNLKNIYADLLEECNSFHVKRFEVLTTYNLEDKLLYLKEEFPTLLKELNDSLLASFLGLNRETFVRNKNSF